MLRNDGIPRAARRLVAAAALAAGFGCRGTASSAGDAASSAAPLFRVEARDHAFRAPARVATAPGGLVRVRLVNRGAAWHEALIVRLEGEGRRAATYVDSVRAGADFPGFAVDLGGPGLTVPGDSTDLLVPLAPGRYALVCWFADHVKLGMVHDFEVTPDSPPGVGPETAAEPAADLVATMFDYAFRLSGPVAAGPHLIRVENRGPQPHELDFFRLRPGRTARDYLAWTAGGRKGPAPAVPVGGTLDFLPGHRVWLPVTFERGRHFAVCHVPDAGDGRPHYDRGMVLEFDVP